MERGKRIEALDRYRESWRHCDENKFVRVYPKPLVAMLDAVFEERLEMEQEIKRLREKAGE